MRRSLSEDAKDRGGEVQAGMHQSTRKRWLASIGAVAAVATLATGGAVTAQAADAPVIKNADVAYPSFKGSDDPMKTAANNTTYNPAVSYLQETFDNDVKNLAGIDTDHDFWIDKILTRTGAQPTGKGTNDKGAYSYEGSDGNNYLFTRGRAAYMYTHTPNQLGLWVIPPTGTRPAGAASPLP